MTAGNPAGNHSGERGKPNESSLLDRLTLLAYLTALFMLWTPPWQAGSYQLGYMCYGM